MKQLHSIAIHPPPCPGDLATRRFTECIFWHQDTDILRIAKGDFSSRFSALVIFLALLNNFQGKKKGKGILLDLESPLLFLRNDLH